MQVSKKTHKALMAVYADPATGDIRHYERNGKAIIYKSMAAVKKYLAEQTEEVKGYYETVVTERVVLNGLSGYTKHNLKINN